MFIAANGSTVPWRLQSWIIVSALPGFIGSDGWVRSNVALGLFVEAEHRRPRGRIHIQANAEGLRSVPRGQGALHALDLDLDR